MEGPGLFGGPLSGPLPAVLLPDAETSRTRVRGAASSPPNQRDVPAGVRRLGPLYVCALRKILLADEVVPTTSAFKTLHATGSVDAANMRELLHSEAPGYSSPAIRQI
ncbi:MAG: hypothetical protein ACLU9S_11705 [Oscillospiraceae bacterium]